jgi:hypothetical protein
LFEQKTTTGNVVGHRRREKPHKMEGQEVSAEKLLIKAQSMHECLMFETRERFGKNIGNLFGAGDMFDGIRSSFVMVSNEVVSNVNMLGPLIIWFAFGDRFGSCIIGVKDRRWNVD